MPSVMGMKIVIEFCTVLDDICTIKIVSNDILWIGISSNAGTVPPY